MKLPKVTLKYEFLSLRMRNLSTVTGVTKKKREIMTCICCQKFLMVKYASAWKTLAVQNSKIGKKNSTSLCWKSEFRTKSNRENQHVIFRIRTHQFIQNKIFCCFLKIQDR